MLQGIDLEALQGLLSEAVGRRLRVAGATALGKSTRAAPFKIDVEADSWTASYLLRHGEACSRNEVAALDAMRLHSIPTPRVVFWDEAGSALGTTLLVAEWIDGEPLLPAMTAGEPWALDLYLDTACALQAITAGDLAPGSAGLLEGGGPIRGVIDAAYDRMPGAVPLREAAYRRLLATQPAVPDTAFGNGDLWPENMLVSDRRLAGVIDWQHAGWSDPIFEFLLPFFLVPALRGRGIEEEYCLREGYDPDLLDWYRGVEYFDSLAWVLKTGEPYGEHTADSLTGDLERWMAG